MARRNDPIKTATAAHTDLNTFASVATILEGGHLYSGEASNKAAAKIIAICKAEQARLLRRYDLAVIDIKRAMQSEENSAGRAALQKEEEGR